MRGQHDAAPCSFRHYDGDYGAWQISLACPLADTVSFHSKVMMNPVPSHIPHGTGPMMSKNGLL
jgi:hypothetical protein